MANVIYGAIGLTGGTTGFLDAIDGAILVDKDICVVAVGSVSYIYTLSAASGAVESSPYIIAPDSNAGTKRWLLAPQGVISTWTPAIAFGGAAVDVTYASQIGYYTRLANVCIFSGRMELTSNGSSTGAASITGLPFACRSSGWTAVSLSLANVSFADQYSGYVNASSTTILLYETTNAGTKSTLTQADVSDTAEIFVSGNYFIS